MQKIIAAILLLFAAERCVAATPDTTITIPLGGNAWRNSVDTTGGDIKNAGIVNWTSVKTSFTAWIRFNKTGIIKLFVEGGVPAGKSGLMITISGKRKHFEVSGNQQHNVFAGEWSISDTGYTAV